MAGSVRSAVCWVPTGTHSVVGPTAKAGEDTDGWRVDVGDPEDPKRAETLLTEGASVDDRDEPVEADVQTA